MATATWTLPTTRASASPTINVFPACLTADGGLAPGGVPAERKVAAGSRTRRAPRRRATPSLTVLVATLFPGVAWERALPTLLARKDALHGLAAASAERIEGWALWREAGDTAQVWGARNLIPPLGWDRIVLPRLSEAEVPPRVLERDGYHPARRTVVFAARAAAA